MQFFATMEKLVLRYYNFFLEGVRNTLIIAFFAVLLGTVLAGGILMLIFLLDTRPRSPEDVMRYANLPTLAVIPANPSMNGSNPRRRKARKQ